MSHAERNQSKLATYLRLLHRHRGEVGGAYDEVVIVDVFVACRVRQPEENLKEARRQDVCRCK